MVADIRSGSASSEPRNLTVVGGTLLFTADDYVNGRELWSVYAARSYQVEHQRTIWFHELGSLRRAPHEERDAVAMAVASARYGYGGIGFPCGGRGVR